VGIDRKDLQALCARTLATTNLPELGERVVGKVRDSYLSGSRRTLVVTDRVSCFDRVVGTIPLKGQVLNQMAAFWFEQTKLVAKNHLISVPDPNVSIVKECKTLPVEFVMRGYLTGTTSTSIWTAYARGDRRYCGHALPDGLRRHERLPEPLLTPTTKALLGAHDELTSRDEILARGTLSESLFDAAQALVERLFAEGTRLAKKRGLILVDTKYELGLDEAGELIVVDEIHTPDSSRYWRTESYEKALAEGTSPPAIDKEYVRLWLAEQGYRGEGKPPALPIDVRVEAATRYIDAYEQVTGQGFVPDMEEPTLRIRRNLGLA
jgi:phosphoribosylaminoimidazole-succinocarboxamide synthase